MTDRLSADEIASLCATPASKISVFDSLPSTNTYLAALARGGEKEGRVILAEAQSAGRGRLGRSFFSPSGSGIYMSILFRPRHLDAGRLTTLAAVVVADAIERVCGIKAGIKWVNDLVFDGKKLCGILAEGVGTEFAVLGIGINVKQSALPSELVGVATSLEEILGVAPSRNRLIAQILWGFAQADIEGAAHMDEYRRRSITLGKTVRILSTGETVFVLAIEDDGALSVRDGTGGLRHISSGEVSVREDGGSAPQKKTQEKRTI